MITGVRGLVTHLRKLQATIERNRDRATRSAARLVARAIRHEAPVDREASGRRGGKSLRRSVMVQPVPGVGYVVGPRSPLTHLVVKGTRPHQEFPKSRSAIAFPEGGATMFTASVQHPGAKANPFIQRALTLANREEAVKAAGIVLHDGAEVPDTP